MAKHRDEFLKLVWPLLPHRDLRTPDGAAVEVRGTGEYNPAKDCYSNAEIAIGGVVYHGDVVTSGTNGNPSNNSGGILHLVAEPSAVILKPDGTPLPQAVLAADPVMMMSYELLREGAGDYVCAGHIARMETHERVAMFTRLLAERMARKCRDLNEIYEEHDQNWNETMYIMLLRTMGDSKNKETFTELARRVRYTAVSRERNSLLYVESMLLGASGLLEMYDDDSYIRELKATFDYLRQKYSIAPMEAGRWVISRTNPNNHPVLRIAQMATFLATREFLFDNLIKCRTLEDIHNMFRAEASQYWSTHYIPSQPSLERPKRIGHFKASLLGINLVVPMMFAYAGYIGDEKLRETALDILEKINCEDNKFINAWRAGGVPMESAFDSQAMLQLNNEFCLRGLCWQCPVAKRVMRKSIAAAQ